MKATGIVRRIDDLGRVVIPKEIRRTMRIREGDPLEIYTSAGEVVFKKYSQVGEMSGLASGYLEALSANSDIAMLICDRDHCVAACGIPKKDVLGRSVSEDLERTIASRQSTVVEAGKQLIPLEDSELEAAAVVPIISAGDMNGSVVLLRKLGSENPNGNDIKMAHIAASFLGRQME